MTPLTTLALPSWRKGLLDAPRYRGGRVRKPRYTNIKNTIPDPRHQGLSHSGMI